MKQRIVCAANKHRAGHILLGIRHWDEIMHDQRRSLGMELDREDFIRGNLLHNEDFIQGFIDNNGNFHTREEAYIVAKEAGQILEKTGGKDSVELFSEDIY